MSDDYKGIGPLASTPLVTGFDRAKPGSDQTIEVVYVLRSDHDALAAEVTRLTGELATVKAERDRAWKSIRDSSAAWAGEREALCKLSIANEDRAEAAEAALATARAEGMEQGLRTAMAEAAGEVAAHGCAELAPFIRRRILALIPTPAKPLRFETLQLLSALETLEYWVPDPDYPIGLETDGGCPPPVTELPREG